jgi:hypothetical protein
MSPIRAADPDVCVEEGRSHLGNKSPRLSPRRLRVTLRLKRSGGKLEFRDSHDTRIDTYDTYTVPCRARPAQHSIPSLPYCRVRPVVQLPFIPCVGRVGVQGLMPSHMPRSSGGIVTLSRSLLVFAVRFRAGVVVVEEAKAFRKAAGLTLAAGLGAVCLASVALLAAHIWVVT